MRNKDKVLDDLRNVQSRDSSSVVKARVSIGRISAMAKQKIASREKPYGAKRVEPIERPKVDIQICQFDTTTTGATEHSPGVYTTTTIDNTYTTCAGVYW